MKRYILAILMLLFATTVFAEGEATIGLATAPINKSDMESVKRGAKFFASTCMSCHTMIYLRYDPIAQEAGITYDKMPINVKEWPYGVVPPDLSLEISVRGVNWVYTYLHSFYTDKSRPTGVNNLLVPGTAMPGIISAYQGEQVLLPATTVRSGLLVEDLQWYDKVELIRQGSMTPDQFDAAMADLVNFLSYAAEPYRAEQHQLGWWVLGFLVILFILMYALKKEYWKDVKKHKKEE
jgi:ubiquinol-cytochrome c reductase cytochrome c1 subunit